jgi:heme exporter protein A
VNASTVKPLRTGPTLAAAHAAGAAVTAACVRAVSLGKALDDRAILQGIDLEIRAGEFVAVLGANGAGKSTLLRLLATLTHASSGELHLFGRRVTTDCRELRARIGLIGHQSMLYRDLTARENLEFFGRLYDVPDAASRAARLLEVMGLSDRADDPVKTFSRGMVQRVAIARALVHDPDLILADEPFDGLDAPSVAATEELLRRLHENGKTVVLVNHDIAQSLKVARRIVVLSRGRLRVDAAPRNLDAATVLAEAGAA